MTDQERVARKASLRLLPTDKPNGPPKELRDLYERACALLRLTRAAAR
jgi:hypothetical protein